MSLLNDYQIINKIVEIFLPVLLDCDSKNSILLAN